MRFSRLPICASSVLCAPGPAPFLGSEAIGISPDGRNVYVASSTSTPSTGQLVQQTGTSACVLYVLAVGCSLGQGLSAPEGLAVSPDGASVYATAFASNAISVTESTMGRAALLWRGHGLNLG